MKGSLSSSSPGAGGLSARWKDIQGQVQLLLWWNKCDGGRASLGTPEGEREDPADTRVPLLVAVFSRCSKEVTLEPRWSERGREETLRKTMKNVEHENVSLGLLQWEPSASKRNTSLNLT